MVLCWSWATVQLRHVTPLYMEHKTHMPGAPLQSIAFRAPGCLLSVLRGVLCSP